MNHDEMVELFEACVAGTSCPCCFAPWEESDDPDWTFIDHKPDCKLNHWFQRYGATPPVPPV